MLHSLYRGVTASAGPVLRLYLEYRRRNGKEDSVRLDERFGTASRPRPAGQLVWFHAASVGEAVSILTVLERLYVQRPKTHVLVTTGTVTSARLMAHRLPQNAIHQFVPVDHPAAVCRFLDHWRPDMAVWVESELWPNLLAEVKRRGIPAALINARMSIRSFMRWRKMPGFIRGLLETFSLCLTQTEDEAERLRALGAGNVHSSGNLKYAADPLPVDPASLSELQNRLKGRKIWLLASSHAGEEELAAEAQRTLGEQLPGVLAIIAPRHPGRGTEIAAALRAKGLKVAQRSQGEMPDETHAIYLADTMGEMGIFYRLAPVVCMGKSLLPPGGGQNPIEPAQLGAAVLYGPYMDNFAVLAHELDAAQACIRLPDAGALASAVRDLLVDADERERLVATSQAVIARHAKVADDVTHALVALLDKAA